MILSFSKTKFIDRIKNGVKIHSIREDKGSRWMVGKKIHFWMGSPRNTRNKIQKPYQFGIGEVENIKSIKIDFFCGGSIVMIDGMILQNIDELNQLAINDGFDNWDEMRDFFKQYDDPFVGKMIFWKDFK